LSGCLTVFVKLKKKCEGARRFTRDILVAYRAPDSVGKDKRRTFDYGEDIHAGRSGSMSIPLLPSLSHHEQLRIDVPLQCVCVYVCVCVCVCLSVCVCLLIHCLSRRTH
jgi:hypothetical protein